MKLMGKILTMFVFGLVGLSLTSQIASAASLKNVSITLSGTHMTEVSAAASSSDTLLSVRDASGFGAGDGIFITGTNETAYISSIAGNTLTLTAGLTNAHSIGDSVTKIQGVDLIFDFDTATAGYIDYVNLTWETAATTDDASFASGSSTITAGLVGGTDSATAATYTLEADNSYVAEDGSITFTIHDALLPDGTNQKPYTILIETKQTNAATIDEADAFIIVDTGVKVTGNVDETLTFLIEDDQTVNNASDNTGTTVIALGTLSTDWSDNATSGYGIDGLRFTLTTNAANGATVNVHSTDTGLRNSQSTELARPTGVVSDNGIDDYSGTGSITTGVEQYAYMIGDSAIDDGSGTGYDAFPVSSAPDTIMTETTPVTNSQKFMTIIVSITGLTAGGIYQDVLTFVATARF